jgi:hypothetical protein
MATSEVEHAVCRFTLGPRSPSLYEVQVAMKFWLRMPLCSPPARAISDGSACTANIR